VPAQVERLKAALTSTHSIMFANASAASPGKYYFLFFLLQILLFVFSANASAASPGKMFSKVALQQLY
jgi:hypothetical protein